MTPQHVFELARHLTERDREIALRLYDVQVRWRKETFQGRHEPLVDEDTFSRARALLSERGEDFAARRANNPTSCCVLLLEDNARRLRRTWKSYPRCRHDVASADSATLAPNLPSPLSSVPVSSDSC